MRYLIWLLLLTGVSSVQGQAGANVKALMAGTWVAQSAAGDRPGYTLRETLTFQVRPTKDDKQRGVMRTGYYEKDGQLFDASNRFVGYQYVQNGRFTLEPGDRQLQPNVVYLLVEQAFQAEEGSALPQEKPRVDSTHMAHSHSAHMSEDSMELMSPYLLDYRYQVTKDELRLTLLGAEVEKTTVYTRAKKK